MTPWPIETDDDDNDDGGGGTYDDGSDDDNDDGSGGMYDDGSGDDNDDGSGGMYDDDNDDGGGSGGTYDDSLAPHSFDNHYFWMSSGLCRRLVVLAHLSQQMEYDSVMCISTIIDDMLRLLLGVICCMWFSETIVWEQSGNRCMDS